MRLERLHCNWQMLHQITNFTILSKILNPGTPKTFPRRPQVWHPTFSPLYYVLDQTNHICSESLSSGYDNDQHKDTDKNKVLQRLNDCYIFKKVDMTSCDDKHKVIFSEVKIWIRCLWRIEHKKCRRLSYFNIITVVGQKSISSRLEPWEGIWYCASRKDKKGEHPLLHMVVVKGEY